MSDKKIRIFNTPWHVAHQAELYKTPDTLWVHCVNTVRKWSTWARPWPANLSQTAYYEPGKYDLAVLHVDQQCVDETLGKSRLYRELNAAVQDIPKIVIQHGTPYWPEAYEQDEIIRKMRMMIGDNHVVYNSHRAKEMWEKNGPIGKSSRVIIHGMDPTEWSDLPKEPRVITTLSPGGLPKYYNRNLLMEVQSRLAERGIMHVWIGGEGNSSRTWSSKGFEDYRDYIAKSLIYFNPTLESPMPRSRTEAMLSGACVVTLANHGAETFIQNGVNGFHVPNNPDVCADLIEKLVKQHYKLCVEIGQKGKQTARELFALERFNREWRELIREVTGK